MQLSFGMKIGLVERESSFLNVEIGAYHSVEILLPNPYAVHGGFSSDGEDPFISGFEEIGTNHE